MEEHVIQPFHSLFPALDAFQLIQTLCGLVAQQQGGNCLLYTSDAADEL